MNHWQRLNSTILSDYAIFRLKQEEYENRKTGFRGRFYVCDTPDWVNIIALTAQQQVVFIDQFRFGTARLTLEIPGGMVDPGEAPAASALRELREETGYTAGECILLGTIEPNPAFLSNRCHSYLALDCRQSQLPAQEASEDITTRLIELTQVPQLLANETITHSLVAVAFQKLALRYGADVFTRGLS